MFLKMYTGGTDPCVLQSVAGYLEVSCSAMTAMFDEKHGQMGRGCAWKWLRTIGRTYLGEGKIKGSQVVGFVSLKG